MTDTATALTAPETPATPAPAGAPAGEEGELLALHARDPQTFEYAPYGDTGRTAAERLVEIRSARETDKAEQEAEGDDLPDLDIAATEGETGEEVEAGEPEAPEPGSQYDLDDFSYTPPEGTSVTEVGQERINAFAEFAHQQNMQPEIFESAVNFYNDLAKKEQARLAETDKTARIDLVADLKGELGATYTAFKGEVDAAFRELPQELRTALRSARLPDGRLLMSLPEAVHMVHALNPHQSQATIQPTGSRAAMQDELAAIDELMHRDIDQYHRRWRATGVSASERRLQLMRELGSDAPAKPSAADLRAEQRELEALRTRDIQLFMYGDWKGSGRPAADRLANIQAGRA